LSDYPDLCRFHQCSGADEVNFVDIERIADHPIEAAFVEELDDVEQAGGTRAHQRSFAVLTRQRYSSNDIEMNI
jgi:hypothetical protein